MLDFKHNYLKADSHYISFFFITFLLLQEDNTDYLVYLLLINSFLFLKTLKLRSL